MFLYDLRRVAVFDVIILIFRIFSVSGFNVYFKRSTKSSHCNKCFDLFKFLIDKSLSIKAVYKVA